MIPDNLSRCGAKGSRPPIISKAFPRAKDFVVGRAGKGLDVWKFLEEAFEVRETLLHARLLEGDFRHQNPVRVARLADR